MNAIERAIQCLQPATQAELARVCQQRPQAITRWVKSGHVPAHYVLQIEKATEAKVTRHDLRPDVFGPAPADAKKRKRAA